MSMKNSNDTTGNRTPDLPTCSATASLRAPVHYVLKNKLLDVEVNLSSC